MKKVYIEVDADTWRRIKLLAHIKGTRAGLVVNDFLAKFMQKNNSLFQDVDVMTKKLFDKADF